MTPNGYRRKHKRCGTCKYWILPLTDSSVCAGKCKVKVVNKFNTDGKFCRVYKPKEFVE